MLHLILADSELETVPKKISSNENIQKEAQRNQKEPAELILDSNYHHEAMRKLEDSERRGRPDMVHICSIAALDSPSNREGLMKFYVHTRQDKILDFKPETRIPRSYNRFIGLMEQLFATGKVPPEGKPLIEIQNITLQKKLEKIQPSKVLTLTKEGEKHSEKSLFENIKKEKDICAIIGGFPKGSFLSDVETLSDEKISIYPERLNAISALTHIVQLYEEEYGVI